MTKAIKKFETTLENFGNDLIQVEIVHNRSVRIHGFYYGQPFDKTFEIGDMAEYGSYNLSYFGPITSITEKSITIAPKYGNGKKTRLKLSTFVWRNWNFDLERKTAENHETSLYI